ncbi:MAG: hypothetical protein N3F07_00960 [Candidatus Micrarchaeota archaeon]|nr:hypothetical protein [Candidatus Micrarchaeota archaeon]
MPDSSIQHLQARLLFLFSLFLGAAFFFLGVLDGLFFQPPEYSKSAFGMAFSREDLYYASLTLSVALFCAAFALAAEIGRSIKPSALRFFLFASASSILFSVWIWAIGWMQISPTMFSGANKPLDLWRFGGTAIYINTFDFPLLIAASLAAHILLIYQASKTSWLSQG